ncbi:hypothetical protein [Lysinibacillus fusiformis]
MNISLSNYLQYKITIVGGAIYMKKLMILLLVLGVVADVTTIIMFLTAIA